MGMPSLIRSVHLIQYTNRLREIGEPVSREIERVGLPPAFEEQPESYVHSGLACDLVTHCTHLDGKEDLGLEVAWQLKYEHLGLPFRTAAKSATTVKERLDLFAAYAWQEEHRWKFAVRQDGNTAQVFALRGNPPKGDIRKIECLQLKAIIEVVRTICGKDWLPSLVTFRTPFTPCDAVMTELGNTRVLTGHKTTSVAFPRSILARLAPTEKTAFQCDQSHPNSDGAPNPFGAAEHGSLSSFCNLIYPYLSEEHFTISQASELVGCNVRSLQRKLDANGTNYREVLNRMRCARASSLIAETDMKVIDIAVDVGYQNATHFTRSFKKVTGLTPSEYRECKKAG